MSLNRSKKRQLSTLHTARLVSSLMLLAGFLFFITSIFLPALPELLPRLKTLIQGTATQSTATQGTATQGTATEGSSPEVAAVENAAASLQTIIPDWVNFWTLFLVAVVLIWAGYLLKTLVILAETQFVE